MRAEVCHFNISRLLASLQPGAVGVLRFLTVVLILVTGGVAGGVSYNALAAAEEDGVRPRLSAPYKTRTFWN